MNHPRPSPLAERLGATIRREGSLRFDRFMRSALYDSQYGYYRRGASSANDYITSPRVHPAFGVALAGLLDQMADALAQDSFAAVELGAGDGLLAADIKQASKNTFGQKSYTALDIAPGQAGTDAVKPLSEAPHGQTGCLLSNELLDALPVRRFKFECGRLQELFVAWSDEGRLVVDGTVVGDDDLNRRVVCQRGNPPEGLLGEVCFELGIWASQVDSILAEGYILTIDYGCPREQLYSAAHINGTLNCAYRQSAGWDPLDNIGLQDMSAYVDFTAVDEALEPYGFRKLLDTTQAELLARLGVSEWVEGLRAMPLPIGVRTANTAAIRKLLDPEGLGGFRVVLHARNAPPLKIIPLSTTPPLLSEYEPRQRQL